MAENVNHNRKAVWAWYFYDFGNSAFTTLIVTFIYATYYAKVMAASELDGTWLWSIGVSFTAVTVALLSPLLGAAADRTNKRKMFLLGATLMCVLASIMLYFQKPYEWQHEHGLPHAAFTALFWFIVGNIAFELGCSFYNSFLPDIAPAEKIGRISGFGWGFGYVGGLLCMVLALVGFIQPETPWFGFGTEASEHIRATNLLVGVWMLLFCMPIFIWLKEPGKYRTDTKDVNLIAESYQRIKETAGEIKKYRQLVRFLIANLFYNDALVTIFSMGAVYATVVLHFTTEEIMIFGIVLNVMAGMGAALFGFLDDKLGGKKTISYSIWGLLIAVILATVAPDKTTFWVAGILVGIFAGPNQSASRSLMGRFVPPEKESEFYGFFAFSGKATSFLGPFLFGNVTILVEQLFGGEAPFAPQRAGIAVLIVLFTIGWILLRRVDEAEGMTLAKVPDEAPKSNM